VSNGIDAPASAGGGLAIVRTVTAELCSSMNGFSLPAGTR